MPLHHPADDHPHPHQALVRPTRREVVSSILAATVLAPWALGRAQSVADVTESFRQRSEDAERVGLAEPFKGITTDGTVMPGLYEIAPTGVSQDNARNAAVRFISLLNDAQLVRTLFPVDDIQWRKWMNQGYYTRQGVGFREMTTVQREAAFDMMRASLSARGFELTRNIMRLNETLAELTNDHLVTGEWAYNITILGKPSATQPWGWQFQGPHAIINYFVLGDQVVMTPLFIGSEPTHAVSGKYKGLEVLQEEQDAGLKLIHTLSSAQQQQAILNFSKTKENNLTEAFKDNIVLDYAGLRSTDLAGVSRQGLRELIRLYVGNMGDGHARIKMSEIEKHLDDTWFAWIGGTAADSVYYYRIQSPVVVIEFDHQPPANLARFSADPDTPTRKHIHCVLRTPNGNDYGKDLLRQHYMTHPHAT